MFYRFIVFVKKFIKKFFRCEKNTPFFCCEECQFNPDPKSYFIHAYKVRKELGTYSGLNVSSDLTVKALKKNGFKAESFGFNGDNEIDKVLFEQRPSHIIIKAFWIKKNKIMELAKKYPSCNFIVVCHSKPSFLATEQNGFIRFEEVIDLSKKITNVYVASNNLDMAQAMEAAYNAEILYLPNIVEAYDRQLTKPFIGDVLRVGIFCAVRPMKNIMTQALAAIKFCNEYNLDLELHVLTGRIEMGGDVTVKNLRDLFNGINSSRYTLIEHQWLIHKEFKKLINEMDIGLQASFTESFNIVAIDFMQSGIPVITSPAIDWSPKEWMVNPDNIEDIKDKILTILQLPPQEKEDWLQKGEEKLKDYNFKALKIYEELSKKSKKW